MAGIIELLYLMAAFHSRLQAFDLGCSSGGSHGDDYFSAGRLGREGILEEQVENRTLSS